MLAEFVTNLRRDLKIKIMTEHNDTIQTWIASLNYYDDLNKWDSDDIATLISYQYYPPYEIEDTSWIAKKTTLVIPRAKDKISEKNIDAKVRANSYYKTENEKWKPEPEEEKPKVDIMTADDEEILTYFRPRGKADLSARRMRFSDVRRLYILMDKSLIFKERCKKFRNLDYITVCNLLLATYYHTERFDRILTKLDAYRDIIRFAFVTSTINQIVKKYPCDMDFRLEMAEAAGLTGYRQPPFPGFDPKEETRSLCEGGEEHGLYGSDWLSKFEKIARKTVRAQQIANVEFLTLEEYIKSDKAITSGASSKGKVEYEFEGETEKFKARKNFLLDIFSPGELYASAIKDQTTQHATAFVKPELGKCRIAVTGDIDAYYNQSYLNYLSGHAYLTWPSNTLEESRIEQAERMERMIKLLKNRYSLPFDYKGFDHQPTTAELKILMTIYLECALHNTPPEQREEISMMISNVVESFANATASIWVQGHKYVYKVTGGVQSGIRFTSLLGNFWNMVMSAVARELVTTCVDDIQCVYVRGDDSAIIADSYASALLFRLAYKAINAVGHDAKYGIHFQQSEFLRVWYTSERLYGYPNRAIPGLMQRKPWTAEPWDAEATIKNLFDTCGTIERRAGYDMTKTRQIIIEKWQEKRKVSKRYLSTPRNLGGLGLMPWDGWIPSKPYPKIDKGEAKFRAKEGSELRYQEKYEKYVTLSLLEARKLQQIEMNAKTSGDDIPGYNRILRFKFTDALRKLGKVEWTMMKGYMIEELSTLRLDELRNMNSIADQKVYETIRPALFGAYALSQQTWMDLKTIEQVREIEVAKTFEQLEPECYQHMRTLERKGWHRGMALDYLFGKIEGIQIGSLHSMTTTIISNAVANAMSQYADSLKGRDKVNWIVAHVTAAAVNQFKQSRLNEKMYQW